MVENDSWPKKEPSFLTYKVTGQDGDAVWLEVMNDSYQGRMIQKILVAFGNRTDPSQVQLRAISTKDTKGRVNEVPPAIVSMMQGMYRSTIAGLIINWQGMPQESVSVPAGRFEGCFKRRTEAQYGMFKSTADSWSHPAVPLSGAVRSQGVDHQFTMELATFGTSGAVNEF